MSRNLSLYAAACAAIALCVELACAQSLDTPQTRMRRIGSGSAVDQYRSPAPSIASQNRIETTSSKQNSPDQPSLIRQASTTWGDNPPVRQTVLLQQSGIVAPNLPGGNFSLPSNPVPGGSSTLGLPGNVMNVPPTAPTVSGVPGVPSVLPKINPLPRNPPSFNSSPNSSAIVGPRGNDFAPIPQPQLESGFATIDNCNCISGPSSYSAASGIGCGVAPCGYAAPAPYAAPQTYAAPPAQISPQVIMPGVSPTGAPTTASAAPVPSLITLGQQTFPVEVGQGLWGQPVAYVPGQGIRNWVRYFFP